MDSIYKKSFGQDLQDEQDNFTVSGHRPVRPAPRRDETVKIASAYRRKFVNHLTLIGDAGRYQTILDHYRALAVKITIFAKRVVYFGFHRETGNYKYPVNPVNPVYL